MKRKGKNYEKNTNDFGNKLMYSCTKLRKWIRMNYYKKCKFTLLRTINLMNIF